MCQNFSPFYGWIIFRCTNIPFGVYPVTCQWTLGLAPFSGIVNSAAMNFYIQGFVWIPVFNSLGHRLCGFSSPPATLFTFSWLVFCPFTIPRRVGDQPVDRPFYLAHVLDCTLLSWKKSHSIQGCYTGRVWDCLGLQRPASSFLILSQNPPLPHSHCAWSHCEAFLL